MDGGKKSWIGSEEDKYQANCEAVDLVVEKKSERAKI